VLILALGATSVAAADLYVGRAALERGDHTTAVRELRPLAEHGDPEAQFLLGRAYESGGQGVANPEEAAVWFGRAASLGHLGAQFRLGRLFEDGRGQPRDIEQALSWYRKAAQGGSLEAQTHLARLYEDGVAVEPDLALAVRWYRKAAIAGGAQARYRLGLLYWEGRGVPPNPDKAANWMKKAARQEHAEAQYELARMFEEGRGVKANPTKASQWYARAAEQDHPAAQQKLAQRSVWESEPIEPVSSPPPTGVPEPVPATAATGGALAGAASEASPGPESEPTVELSPPGEAETGAIPREASDPEDQYRLAHMYSSGQGRPFDGGQAEHWFLRAAEQGHSLAMYQLAFLYWRGRGASGRKEHVNALVWFSLAADRGVGDAANWRDEVAKKLSRQEKADSARLLDQRRLELAGPGIPAPTPEKEP
jgi:TPR repeat protein